MKRSGGRNVLATALFGALLAGPAQIEAVDFIRGDVNSDGEVTLADSHMIMMELFVGIQGFNDCRVAGDTDDNNRLELSDAIVILNVLFFGRDPLPPPFPEAGPDPTPDPGEYLICESYGGGTPFEDDAAELVVLDATAPGGKSRLAKITLAISGSASAGGYVARIAHGGIIADVGGGRRGLRDLTLPEDMDPDNRLDSLDFVGTSESDDRLTIFALLTIPRERCDSQDEPLTCTWVPAGERVPVLDIYVCLEPGTPAGTYDLTLEAGELVRGASGQTVHPALVSGTLTVLVDVESGSCDPNPPLPQPPPDVTFRLDDTTTTRGASMTVPFRIEATMPSQGFSFSVDFDEEVLQATGIQRLFERPSGTPYDFERFEFNNENDFPGNTGLLEGYLVGAAIISLSDTEDVLPTDEEVAVLDFHFAVDSETTAEETQLLFLDGAIGGGGAPVGNQLFAGGVQVTPETASSFVFIHSRIQIIPDVIVFIRGDSNDDRRVDLSDAVRTLGYLFLGNEPVSCLDAADADDDGGITLTDPIYTLEFLFRGGTPMPSPYPAPGMDPTPDAIGCFSGNTLIEP